MGRRRAQVLHSRAMKMLFTVIRDKRTSQREYVAAADRLMAMLAVRGRAAAGRDRRARGGLST
eukprot:SAG11_NODE_7347_length_1157_cov_2.379017_1_plen_62_part_10